jgi:hypothetical protein
LGKTEEKLRSWGKLSTTKDTKIEIPIKYLVLVFIELQLNDKQLKLAGSQKHLELVSW